MAKRKAVRFFGAKWTLEQCTSGTVWITDAVSARTVAICRLGDNPARFCTSNGFAWELIPPYLRKIALRRIGL